MAKFCGNCGSKLNGGEPFCSQCGYRIENAPLQPAGSPNTPQYAPPPAPQAQPSYASPRPAPTPSYDAPQPTPAAAPPAPSPAPAPRPQPAQPQSIQPLPVSPQAAPPAPQKAAPPSYADFSRSANQSGRQQNNNSPRKKGGCGKCFLVLMLSGFVLALLSAGAAWFFGFFDGDPPEKDTRGRIADSSDRKPSKQEKKPSPPSVRRKKSSKASKTYFDLPYAAPVSSIKAGYSQKDIKNAPKREADVSPQSPKADCGGVKADFEGWNLEGKDTFIVRTLPELTDKETGYVIKGYDFSMASGKDEFAVDVTLTIPRTAKNTDEGFCAAFNEKTGQWERVYSEISKDGKSYNIYTDHFCQKAEILPVEELTDKIAKGVSGEDLENRQVKDYLGVFCYNLRYFAEAEPQFRMTAPVSVNYLRLWSDFLPKYSCTLEDLVNVIQRTPKDKIIYTDPNPTLTFGSETYDTGKLFADLAKLTPNHPAFTVTSGITALISWHNVINKMITDINSGRSAVSSADQNKLALIGSTVATVGIFAGKAAAFKLTVVSAIVYAVTKIDKDKAPRELSVPEQLYRNYFYRAQTLENKLGDPELSYNRDMITMHVNPNHDKENTASNWKPDTFVRHFYYDLSPGDERLSDPSAGNIKRIPDLTDAENNMLKSYINSKKEGLPGSDPRLKQKTPAVWAYTLKTLYKICESKPERLPKHMLNFYTNYANACWQMSDGAYMEFIKKEIEKQPRDYNKNALRLPTKQQKIDYANNMVSEMMKSHSDIIYRLTRTTQNKAKQELEGLIENELLPVLNRRIEFRVTDETLENPKDFSKSVYGAEFQKKNCPRISGSDHIDYSKIETPMAFGTRAGGGYERVAKPKFRPWLKISNGHRNSCAPAGDYSPYQDNFLPKAAPGDNLVFTCTYYHYLLMGVPTAIIFHKMGETGDNKAVPFTLPKTPDSDGVMRVNVKAPAVSEKKKKQIYVFDHAEGSGFADYELEALEKSLKNTPLTVNSDSSFRIAGSAVVHTVGKEKICDCAAVKVSGLEIKGRLGEALGKDNNGILHYSGECTPVSGKLQTKAVSKKQYYLTTKKSAHYDHYKAKVTEYEQTITGSFGIKDAITENPDKQLLKIKCPCEMARTKDHTVKRWIDKKGGYKDEEINVKVTIKDAKGNVSKSGGSYKVQKTLTLYYRRKN